MYTYIIPGAAAVCKVSIMLPMDFVILCKSIVNHSIHDEFALIKYFSRTNSFIPGDEH